MEKRKKQVGRPHIIKGKRSRKIDVRFSDEEFTFVQQLEKLLGLTKADIIRKKVLEVNPQLIFDARALLASLDQVGLELSRSGNNINQLARYANVLNRRRILSAVIINRYLLELEKHSSLMKSIETDIRKILRMVSKS
ncbi:plasmid mobilization protein [Pedobacter sp. MW01-1-1]|uniref:plasmid mobilization protein n=1 Tax=Pedobacter sp. MW01-1-1 TaxID=3383027 RepID=UPI003FEF71B5